MNNNVNSCIDCFNLGDWLVRYDYPSARQVIHRDMGKTVLKQATTKHDKKLTLWIFHGLHCLFYTISMS